MSEFVCVPREDGERVAVRTRPRESPTQAALRWPLTSPLTRTLADLRWFRKPSDTYCAAMEVNARRYARRQTAAGWTLGVLSVASISAGAIMVATADSPSRKERIISLSLPALGPFLDMEPAPLSRVPKITETLPLLRPWRSTLRRSL